MGQYHSVINLDKREGYSPRSIASFVKAAEQGESLIPCAALLLLLSDPGGWGGQRVTLVGDYADDADLEGSPFPASELYGRLDEGNGLTDVGGQVREVVEGAGVAVFSPRVMRSAMLSGLVQTRQFYDVVLRSLKGKAKGPAVAVFNHDKRERLTPALLGDPSSLMGVIDRGWYGGTGTALTILLAASCKGGRRGGGDYDGKDALVGAWAGDRVSVTLEADAPEGYADITETLRVRVMAEQVSAVKYATDGEGVVTRTEGE